MSSIACSKLSRKLQVLSAMVLILLILGFTLMYGAKYFLEFKAENNAEALILAHTTEKMSNEEKALSLARAVYNANLDSQRSPKVPFLLRISPYLTHELMPKSLRIKPGTIEVIYLEGLCDSVARRLNFILETAGYTATQLNIISPTGGHSVTLTQLPSGQLMILDPFFGGAPIMNGRVLGPHDVQELIRQGVPPEDVWQPFEPHSNLTFYNTYHHFRMAQQGRPLTYEVSVNLEKGESFSLGENDNSPADVSIAAMERRWSTYWHYMGHRYDRGWERVINFQHKMRVTFALTSAANVGFITSQIPPTAIHENLVIYELDAGQALHFRDGLAQRDWTSMKSFQDVDYILFEALN